MIWSALAALSACAGSPDRLRTTSEAGNVKIGKPYKIRGKTYYPEDDRDYRETGTASWYGPNFHGKPTANGERFDQNALTAAHRTLPLPSWVRVENLDNGRDITVRVNDRGPFAHNRIIDLSRRAAQLLDMQRAGVARVRVTRVYPDGSVLPGPPETAVPKPVIATAPPPAAVDNALVTQNDVMGATPTPEAAPSPSRDETTPALRSVTIPEPLGKMSTAPVPLQAGSIFVQVAAVSGTDRAVALASALESVDGIDPVVTETSPSGLVRVRVGPYSMRTDAETMLAKLIAAGYEDSRIVSGPVS